MNYLDPIIAAYTDLIKAHNGQLVSFFQGEPLRIAASLLPCCIIAKIATAAGPLNNADDQHQIGLRITVITDVRQDLSSDESHAKVVEGVATLYDIMEGREADYTLKGTSILDILRTNINVNVGNNLRTDLGSLTRIDYGTTLRDRAPEEWTVEARLDFMASLLQAR